ncbi:MAG: sigma-70 family RNA polymerase sigma factor [Deinococcus sp.]|nr:sigma-70 family RNA polymerase sigma factor [Deinococcus sp.]
MRYKGPAGRASPMLRRLATELLVGDVAQGSEEGLEILYDRYHRLVFSFALKMLGSPERAAEVTQDVFLSVWRRSDSFDPRRGNFVNWLLTITRNRALDLLRRRQLPTLEPEEMDWGEEAMGRMETDLDNPEEHSFTLRLAARMRSAVAGLRNEKHRKVIELIYYQQLTQEEVARRLGCPVGTVKSRKKYALESLRKILNGMGLGDAAG